MNAPNERLRLIFAVVYSLALALIGAALLIFVGLIGWRAVVDSVGPPIRFFKQCPKVQAGEALIASYEYPDGAIECRYAQLHVEFGRAMKRRPALPVIPTTKEIQK